MTVQQLEHPDQHQEDIMLEEVEEHIMLDLEELEELEVEEVDQEVGVKLEQLIQVEVVEQVDIQEMVEMVEMDLLEGILKLPE